MKPFRLNRRALLRGLGAVIALPLLDAMLDDRGRLFHAAHAQGGAQPVRLLTFFFPHGVKHDAWNPTTTGPGYALPPCLEPLAPHRADFSVITGLANTAALSAVAQGGNHGKGAGSFANGMPTLATGATGPTIDQFAAAQRGGDTRIRSLVVCADPQTGSFEDGSGVLLNYSSWSGPGLAVPPERDPQRLFERLFGTDSAVAGPAASAAARASILDGALGEITALRGRVGSTDRARLDQHLSSIRDLEREVSAAPTTCARPDAPPVGAMPASPERVQLMLRLVATALRCDLTRFASFALSNGIDATVMPWVGPSTMGHHDLSHLDDHDTIVNIVRYEMQQVAYLLALLKAAPEGDGTALDNSLIFISSEVGDGATHSLDDLPVLVAGRAAGCARPGSHLHFPDQTPISNLYLTLLTLAGVTTPSFGLDGTTLLDGLAS